MCHNSRKIHKICKWSFRRTGKLFVFFAWLSLCGLEAFIGQCSAIFFTGESKIVEVVKTKPGRSFKRYFKQTENALLFCKHFKMLTFSQFSSDILFEPQRHLTFVDIIFKTGGSKKIQFLERCLFPVIYKDLQINLLQRQATDVCLIYHWSVIIHHQTLTGLKFYSEERKHQGILSFYPKTIIDKKDYTNCSPKPPKS